MDDLMSLYIEDMKEYLLILNDSIMALEKDPDDKAAVSEMFRAFHTMKSSTAAMEFWKTADFIHRMEDLLHEIREGRIRVDEGVIESLFRSNDLLENFLTGVIQNRNGADVDCSGIIDEFGEIIERSSGKKTQEACSVDPSEEAIGFRLDHDDLEKLKALVSVGYQAYKLTVVISDSCVFRSVRAWMILDEVSKYYDIIRSWPEKPESEDCKNGKFIFNDTVVCAIIATDTDTGDLRRELDMSMSEIESISIDAMDMEAVSVANGSCHAGVTDDMSEIINSIIGEDAAGSVRTEQKNQAYIKIPSVKVDNLIDLMGELLITQSLHKQEISEMCDKDTNRILNNIMRMERIAKDIQNITMSLRMVSLKQTFQKIYRVGRDTASELGKNVDIIISGEDTEIDRNVVEKIHDPLMHLIRNAISHGIENEEDRLKKGKTAHGNISIQAYNRRGTVYIEISDDGRGLSPDKIYRKAIEKGLADPARKYGDDEIIKLIYLPGFSTEDKVNSISGRGVGMNVVQTEISRLGGKIDIENHPSSGCTFTLKIPVNLATINGTIVDIFGSKYVIPTLGIKQILKPQKEQWISVKGKRNTIKIRNDILWIIPICEILKNPINDEELESGLIMVVEHEKKLMALPVKTVLGKQEVVVKPIGSDFGDLKFISGATILGDGRVSLILDVEALFTMAEDADD